MRKKPAVLGILVVFSYQLGQNIDRWGGGSDYQQFEWQINWMHLETVEGRPEQMPLKGVDKGCRGLWG